MQSALVSRAQAAATEVIPSELLAQVGLAEQAHIEAVDTAKASPGFFDPREGQAGLALVGVSPITGPDGSLVGVAVAFHLFNNDFTLVDQIKDAAGIDTVTIFHGDLRVSTNVLTSEAKRAIGTRISQEVSQVVLGQGREYIGPAFVVNENYITRYDPLRDHMGQVIGSLYVGVRQSSFFRLVNTFNERVILVALATILATFLLAVPVSRRITRPLKELRELAEANRRVAAGDLSVRVPVRAGGDVGQLATSFNSMLSELQATQGQLVHSEKLASLGQLAAGVAHELNNPLATVLLYSDILLRECPPDDPRRVGPGDDRRRDQAVQGDRGGVVGFRSPEPGGCSADRSERADPFVGRGRTQIGELRWHRSGDRSRSGIAHHPSGSCAAPEVLANSDGSNAVEAMSDGGGLLTLRSASRAERI